MVDIIKRVLVFLISVTLFGQNIYVITMSEDNYINYFTVGAVIENGSPTQEIAFIKGLEAANIILSKSEELSKTRLVPAIARINSGDGFQASQKTCDLLRQGVIAIFGPKSTFATQHVQSICNKFGIPHITYNWGYQMASEKYSVNIHPDYQTFGNALLDYLMSTSNRDSLAVVYLEEENLQKYEELMNVFEGRIILRQWSNDRDINKYIIKYLRGTHLQSFLIDLPYWKVKEFLDVAALFNMTTQYYNYFFTSWDIMLVNLQTFKINQGANITAFSITPHIMTHERYGRSDTVEELRKEVYETIIRKQPDIQNLISTEAAFIYDGATILGHSLDRLSRRQPIRTSNLSCGDHRSWAHGLGLVNELKKHVGDSSKTLTGNIVFDEVGRRTNFTLKILEIATHGYQQYGYWSTNNGINVTKNYSQTKEEIYKHLQNTTLRVTTIADPPFVIIKERDAKGNPLPHPDAWDGFCIELLKKIAEEVKFNFTIHEVRDKTYGKFNGTHADGTPSWDGMIGELMDRTADLAVASLTITYDREKVIDFTTPFMSLGLSILYRRPKRKKPHLFSFLQPLSPPVWGYVLAAYILVSFVLFVVARFSPYEWYNPHPCNANSDVVENQFNILNSLWFTIGSLMQQGSDMAPRATSTRIVGGIWWFFTLIIISSYTANLAAFLTVERMKSPIENAEDLSKQTAIKYGTLLGGSTYTFFKKSTISTYERMWRYMKRMKRQKEDVFVKSTKAGIERVMSENYAFILESTWNEYYTQRNCSLMQVGGLLDSKGYGIGLPEGSDYTNLISEAILKLQNDQRIDKLKRTWWREFNITKKCNINADENKAGNNALGLEQVGGVFVVLMTGLLLSIIVSFLEFIYKANMTASAEKLPVCTEMSHELRFAIRCMASSKKPSNRSHQKSFDDLDISERWIVTEEEAGMIDSSPRMLPTYYRTSHDPYLSRVGTHVRRADHF